MLAYHSYLTNTILIVFEGLPGFAEVMVNADNWKIFT